MSMSLPILPIDLQLEIFSYLPCKAIVKFMVLSHLHCSLLISPYFISKHYSKSRSKFVVLMPSSITRLCEDDDHLTLFQKLRFPFEHHNFGNSIIDFGNSIIGICNGIILMKRGGDIFFINPMIRYCFDLPLQEDKSIYKSIYSYGFISRGLSDYIVVKIDSDEKYYTGFGDESAPDELFPPRKAWVYTYVENYWRSLEIPHCSLCTTTTTAYNGVVYYGLLHWGARKWVKKAWYYFILTFDPQTEAFGELLLPDSLATAIYYPYDYENYEFGVFVVQNSTKPLTVYSLISSEDSETTAAVWVMNKYGITESWNQIFTFNCAEDYISSTLFGFNPDIHVHVGFPFLLFHRSDGTLLFGVEYDGTYSIRSLDISHGTSTVLINNVRRNYKDPYMCYSHPSFYIGYSSPSLILLDEVSATRY